ncbi:hypothetical protein GCM10011581_26190 [Saccharopolyspora subtropica]|uniref:Uncharacterized protein n=1 Tax=Saccharopolyspora thermophila TaxID=89367 RepID=A0A917JWT1_9PSEU|nr:hypothetical protein [Saccharopolyspora subtropica]GGI87867.1 hypothetical protein GCM10011581_26190 [Saccharopolyspora subtropica]
MDDPSDAGCLDAHSSGMAAARPWSQEELRANREARSHRCTLNLAVLRAPLAGVELDSRDHAMLTWLADHDEEVVVGMRNLLDLARAAEPLPET